MVQAISASAIVGTALILLQSSQQRAGHLIVVSAHGMSWNVKRRVASAVPADDEIQQKARWARHSAQVPPLHPALNKRWVCADSVNPSQGWQDLPTCPRISARCLWSTSHDRQVHRHCGATLRQEIDGQIVQACWPR